MIPELTTTQKRGLSVTIFQELLERFEVWHCKKDPIYFIMNYCITLDPHDIENPFKKLPNKEYIIDTINAIHNNKLILIEKSRQMMMTWVTILYFLWDILFHEGRKYIFQCKNEDDAFQFIDRLSGVCERIKFKYPFLLKRYSENKNSMESLTVDIIAGRIRIPELKCEIKSIPQGANVIRSFDGTGIFLDEMAFQEYGEEAYRAAKPVIDGGGIDCKLIGISTPNNDREIFYKLAHDKVGVWISDSERKPIEYIMEKTGYSIKKLNNGFIVIHVHYSVDPDKNPETETGKVWYDTARLGTSETEWKSEYEISYTSLSGKPVYPNFNVKTHIKKLTPKNEYEVYRCWDFGKHHPCVLFIQKIGETFYVLNEYFGEDIKIFDFALDVIAFSKRNFQNVIFKDLGDRAGLQDRSSGDSDIKILQAKYGIHVIPVNNYYGEDDIPVIEYLLKIKENGLPNIFIDQSCHVLNEGFKGGYHYPKIRTTGIYKEQPKKDGYYEHPHDCLRYGIRHLYKLNVYKDEDDDTKHGQTFFVKRNKYTGYERLYKRTGGNSCQQIW